MYINAKAELVTLAPGLRPLARGLISGVKNSKRVQLCIHFEIHLEFFGGFRPLILKVRELQDPFTHMVSVAMHMHIVTIVLEVKYFSYQNFLHKTKSVGMSFFQAGKLTQEIHQR